MGTILVKISFIILLYVIIPNHQVFSFFSSDASHSEVLKETPMTVIDTSLCSATWGSYVYYDSLCVISYGSTPCSVSQRERERLCVTCVVSYGSTSCSVRLRKTKREKLSVYTLYSVGGQWGSLGVPGPVPVRGGGGFLLGRRGLWVSPLHLHQAVRVPVMDSRHCQVTTGNQLLQLISAQDEASHWCIQLIPYIFQNS